MINFATKWAKRLVQSISIFMAMMAISVVGIAESPIGIALKVEGKVCVNQPSFTQCKLLKKGTRLYSGNDIVVADDGKLTLLDLENKERISLTAGTYKVDTGGEKKQTSLVRARINKLLALTNRQTAVGGTRAPRKDRDSIAKELASYQAIWQNENHLDFLWAKFGLYEQNGLHPDASEVLQRISYLLQKK